jgi:3-oxoacyl-[acyl-carrier protein] reductase
MAQSLLTPPASARRRPAERHGLARTPGIPLRYRWTPAGTPAVAWKGRDGMERRGRVEDKVALVTGVAKTNSIGFNTARVLGEEGAKLAIVDISDRVHECADELRKAGYEAASFTADLTKMDQVRAMVTEVETRYGRIDVLVNNAGMVIEGMDEDFVDFAHLSEEQWDFGIAINLKTQFNVTRSVIEGMIARGYGRIVNISSVTGPVVANPEESVYCAAKAGVLGMTRGLALDVAKHGITVNAVGPGWINTGSTTEGERAGAENTPMGRAATPTEVGKLVCFLGSDDAGYITGQLVVIDGGNTIQEYKGPSELYY